MLISCNPHEYSKEKAAQYWNNNQFELALSEISNAIKTHPDSSNYYIFRAMIYDAMTKYNEEKDDLDRVIALNYNMREVLLAYHERAAVNLNLGFLKEALNDVNYFIEHRDTVGSLPEVYINKASILYQMGDSVNAKVFYHLALKDNDKSNKISALIGLSNLANSQNEALELLNKALELDSNDALALGNRATIYLEKNNIKGALLDCKKALALDPYIANNNFNLGQIYAMYLNKPDSAIKYFSRAIKLSPYSSNSAFAYMNLALLETEKGNLKKAYKHMKEAEKIMPNNDVIQYNYSHILSSIGKTKMALMAVSKAIEINPNEPEYYNTKGVIFINEHNYKDAVDIFTKCIEVDSTYGGAFYNLGYIYSELNKHSQSIFYYNKAVQLKFDLEATLVNLALQEIKVNKQSDACRHLHNAYVLGRTDVKPLMDKYCK
jgi:tetratricopeptide (TPR) repeat protein